MDCVVEPARKSEGAQLGRMGAQLARLHHAYDALRFMLPDELEKGYAAWLVREARNPKAVVLVARLGEQLAGYAYGRLEPKDWNALRDACGGFHDLWVEESFRNAGVGRLLAEEMMARLVALGAPRVVLFSAARNAAAQRLFQRLGWRPTMVEMTREAPVSPGER